MQGTVVKQNAQFLRRMKYGKLKRAAGILLSAAVILGSLAGCSGKENESAGNGNTGAAGGESTEGDSGEQGMGRFLEEDVTLPITFSNIYDMKKLEDGTIRIIGNNGDDNTKTVWDSKDSGANWEKAYDAPEELQDEDNGYIDYAALSSDGQSAWVYNQIGDGGIKPILYLVDKEGNGSVIPFELPAAEGEPSAASFSMNVPVDGESSEGSETGQGGESSEGSETGQDGESSEGSETGQGGEPSEGSETGQDGESSEGSETGQGGESSEGSETGRDRIKNLILGVRFLGNDQILVKDMADKIFQISAADGSVKQTYDFSDTEESHQVFAAGSRIVLAASSEVLVYDAETGELQETEEALQKSIGESGFFDAVDTADGGESIYYLTGGGLYHYKFGGSIMEQLVDGSMNSLGAPAFYPIALSMLDEENFLVAANDINSNSPGGMALLKYTWSADTPAKPDKELKVYSLYNNREMRQSISSFQKEHTDVYVNYQVAMSEENGVTVSDALKTLTTEIMAGKGPDLMILDGMPIETYIEKGILKDMSSVFAEGGSYFENILHAYQDSQGQLCAVPARFLIPAAQGGSAYYTPGEDFDTFTSKQGILAKMIPEATVEKFWYSCGAAWQKEDKTLDAAKITEFFTKLKNAYGAYDSSAEDDTTAVSISEGGVVNELQRVSLSWGDFDLAFGRYKVNVGLLSKLDYGMLDAVNRKLENGGYGLMPGQAENVFVPAMVLGISSKAAQPETAEELAAYLFSQEAQKVSQYGGFPVEKEAFKSAIDGHEYAAANTEGLVGVAGGSGVNIDERLDYSLVPTPEEEIQKLTSLVESLAVPALLDDVIKDSVIEQGAKVLREEISPEEAADAMMQKVNIYLAE